MSKEITANAGQLDAKKKMNKKKKKKVIKAIIWIVIIAAVIVFLMFKFGLVGKNNEVKASSLTTYTVGTRSIQKVLTSSGTIEPNDQYTVNALVSGEVIADYFEEGDTIAEDQLLFEIDSENLNSSVTRAENSLKNANKSLNKALENLEDLNVESKYEGTIKKLYVEVGDEINNGTLIADVVDDATMCIDVPFMEADCALINVGDIATVTFDSFEDTTGVVKEIGKVAKLNELGVKVKTVTISVRNSGSITTSTTAYAQVGDAYCTADSTFYYNDEGQIHAKVAGEVSKIYYDEGDRINNGNVIIRLESEDLEDQIDKLRDSVKEAEDSLTDAHDAYDNYNIKAPITGKVISKSHKAGDTLSGGQSSGTLAVIYDMSALKFTMSIDELDIDKLDKGQDVVITCDSREGEQYHGTISNISIQGSTSSGTTVYPVEVKIENVEDIDKRTVNSDGSINKVYKTGMTATETEYTLISTETVADAVVYTYSEEIAITVKNDGSIYDGDKLLKPYLNGSYTQGTNFYNFSSDFSTLTLEVQNDKKMLRPGMNIDAQIIVDNRENVIAVPLAAVGRGNVVKVIKASGINGEETEKTERKDEVTENTFPANPEDFEGKMPEGFEFDSNAERPDFSNMEMPEGFKFDESKSRPDFSQMNNGEMPQRSASKSGSKSGYGTADPDTEYEEVKVTVGISNDDYVEITSGLSVGDVVIIETSNLASGAQNMQYGGMMGGSMMGSGMMGGGMMGGMSGPPSMSGGRMPGGMGR